MGEKDKKRPDVQNYLISFIINFVLLIMILIPVNYLTLYFMGSEHEDSLLPIQALEARIVYEVQRALDYNVELEYGEDSNGNRLDMKTVLNYPDMKDDRGDPAPVLEIKAICTGLREIIILSILLLGTGGIAWRKKFIWCMILSSILFAENLLRIFLVYPLAMNYGWDFAWYKFHTFFWEYGQLLTILILFLLWFVLVAQREIIMVARGIYVLRYPRAPFSWRLTNLLARLMRYGA